MSSHARRHDALQGIGKHLADVREAIRATGLDKRTITTLTGHLDRLESEVGYLRNEVLHCDDACRREWEGK